LTIFLTPALGLSSLTSQIYFHVATFFLAFSTVLYSPINSTDLFYIYQRWDRFYNYFPPCNKAWLHFKKRFMLVAFGHILHKPLRKEMHSARTSHISIFVSVSRALRTIINISLSYTSSSWLWIPIQISVSSNLTTTIHTYVSETYSAPIFRIQQEGGDIFLKCG
jgi:hypothetical protein